MEEVEEMVAELTGSANSEFQVIFDQIMTVVTAYGLSVIGGILLLIAGWIVAGWTRRGVERGLGKIKNFDVTLQKFFASLARYVVLAVTILAVLSQFGVQTASLIAVFGAAGLAIGLALQGTLSHVAAGVMLLIFRPFKVGDYIEAAGTAGTVDAINLFVTELNTPDNIHIIVPNGSIWGSSVRNFSHHETRRMDLIVGVGYGDNLDKAIEVLTDVVAKDDRVLKDPEPVVRVTTLGASSVDIMVRIWVKRADFFEVQWAMNKAMKEALDANGLEIPFPQQVVHMVKETA